MSQVRSTVWIVGAALAVLGALYFARSVAEPTIRVAAAADLKFALDELIEVFRRQHPQISVAVSYGSSGSFFAQLSQHAPFDIFFSADMSYPRRLIAHGLALPETEFFYAVGRIVLWVPISSPIAVETLGIAAVFDPTVKKLALANPQHAPYGRAAEAAMKSLGVYDALRAKFVFGESVAQAAQFVQSGAAQMGIVALSLARAPTLREQGRFWEFPLESYPRMEQGGVILKWARDRASAELLRAFVLSKQGQAILQSYGFIVPGE